MNRFSWRGFDRELLAASLGLAIISAVVMVSAAEKINPQLALRHGMWLVVGLLACVSVAQTNYRSWTQFAGIAYGISLIVLLLVPLLGSMRLGATRWLSIFGLSFQPAELAKLTSVWLLAQYLAGQATPLPARVLWTSLALVAPPALLIFLQPDLGTSTVLVAIWLGIVWVAGIPSRLLLGLGLAALAAAPVAWHLLKDYQKDRLMVFINPHADPLGAGYTIIQSTIAIGSGRVLGRGWFSGTQNQLSFLPERHSDFIFSVLGEEWGFLGCLAVAALFAVLLLRAAQIALQTSAPQGRLLAAGIFSWIGYQAFINMGMVMGLLPVVGVPLPFLSYGGSSMVMLWIALGLLHSIRRTDLT